MPVGIAPGKAAGVKAAPPPASDPNDPGNAAPVPLIPRLDMPVPAPDIHAGVAAAPA